MTVRYGHLIDEIKRLKPQTILEIGTWNGKRAKELLSVAIKFNKDVFYYGFDLFEDLTEDIKSLEFNGKKLTSLDEAYNNIKGVTSNFLLVKGNTRETIKNARFYHNIDFVFIDGGHSFETIQSDWDNIKKIMHEDTVVMFDDYYVGDKAKFWGSQKLLDNLIGYNIDVLEPYDTLEDETKVHIVRVKNETV